MAITIDDAGTRGPGYLSGEDTEIGSLETLWDNIDQCGLFFTLINLIAEAWQLSPSELLKQDGWSHKGILPRDNTKFVIVRSEDLMGSIQRVAQFADERSGQPSRIQPRAERAQALLLLHTDAGRVQDTIETPYNYDPLVVGSNQTST